MAVTTDIVATYRGPGKVVTRLLSMGQREDRALIFLMGALIIMFIAEWPWQARVSHLTGEPLQKLIATDVYAYIFLLPLVCYALAGLARIIAKLFGGQGTWYSARLALFWALLAASPIAVLAGLVHGFLGDGIQHSIVSAIQLVALLWFWARGTLVTEFPTKE